MGYSLNELKTDNRSFEEHYWNEIQEAQEEFKNSMANADNMSEDEIAALVSEYCEAELNAMANAADNIASSLSDPAGISLWQGFATEWSRIINSLPSIPTWPEFIGWLVNEIGVGVDQTEMEYIKDQADHLGRGTNEIMNWIPISPAGKVPFCTEVILSNFNKNWNYGYDTSKTPWNDKWWYRYKWFPKVDPNTAEAFNSSRIYFVRRDPLVLDLDGDGIETVGASANIMFDHDGDGNLNGTGWVKADDGFLVLDRNANGSIDNGSELFGVDTVLANGQKAANGFAALSDLDTNSDGIFSAADTQFANVRIWRDLNQDGVSQANELMSLQNSGIASINLNATASGSNQGNGNVVTMTSTYTRTDGTTRTVGSMDFGQDTFNSSFSDYIEPTEQTADLPDMHGSGQVRDLREAATLSGLAPGMTVYL